MLISATLSILFFSLCLANEPLTSPCPRFFSYEPQLERDRWFGVLTLTSEYDLTGITIRLIFDRPAYQIGNWFGRVETVDYKQYLIMNERHRLRANMPFALRFYVRFKAERGAPRLVGFSLNSKVVCPADDPAGLVGFFNGDLQTSGPCMEVATAATTPRSQMVTPAPTAAVRTQSGIALQALGDPGDFFVGDFQLLMQPQIRTRIQTYHETEIGCGIPAPQPLPLITHGNSTRLGEYPWHAAIYSKKDSTHQYLCGATLISRHHVITAATCVTFRQTQTPRHKNHLSVYLGKYYLNQDTNPHLQAYTISQICIHPAFNPLTYHNNIAIIKTETPVKFNDFVRPICLPRGDDTPSGAGTVVGWGFDHTGRLTGELNQAKMNVVTRDVCVKSYPEFFEKFATRESFCAGLRNGTSVCNGDSGGGLAFPKATSDPKTEIWELGGIVSISVASQNQTGCDVSHFAVFTDVAKYSDWINTTLNK